MLSPAGLPFTSNTEARAPSASVYRPTRDLVFARRRIRLDADDTFGRGVIVPDVLVERPARGGKIAGIELVAQAVGPTAYRAG